MSKWATGFVEANGLQLHYTRTGGDLPPVVLAHGFSDDGPCWTPVAEALAPDYDVVMVDARGHGRSDAPETGYGTAELAADLAAAIRGLGLERPAVLGHSMGAATTLVMAGAYPEVAGKILLEDPPTWWVPQSPEAAAEGKQRWQGMRDWAVSLKRKTRAELLADCAAGNPSWSDAELGPWADSKHRMSLNVVNRGFQGDLDWTGTLRRISCPALLITGDPARGAIVGPEAAAALRELVPQLQVAHIPRAGHSIRRDQLARYLAAVLAFLGDA